jgi:GNAT superfamily N-acetyltransferase
VVLADDRRLWVAEALRGQELGRRLLLAAEDLAVTRGCRGWWLGTFDFKARTFYERHGYAVFAELPGFPSGHAHFHLWKAGVARRWCGAWQWKGP